MKHTNLSDNFRVLFAHVMHRRQKFFLDDPLLQEAIKKNDPEKVSEITDSFLTHALGQISQIYPMLGEYLQREDMRYICGSYTRFISEVNGETLKFFSDDRGFLNNTKEIGEYEKMVITIQLTLWSCISLHCLKHITLAVGHFQLRNIAVGDRELWSWLHSFTACVSCSTSCVYDMCATLSEKKYPACQVLLLSTSIHLSLGQARQAFSPTLSNGTNEVLFLKYVTSKFTHYVHGIGKETPIPFSRSDVSLNFFSVIDPICWDRLTKFFEKIVLEGENNIRNNDSEKDDLSRKAYDTAASVLGSSNNKETKKPLRNVTPTPAVMAPYQSIDAVSALGGSIPSFFASVPLVTEENYQTLRRRLVKMKKKLDSNCGIIKAIGDKSNDYLEKCDKFCAVTFGGESPDHSYFAKMVAYSGLLIHDILGVEHNNHLSVHQNLFAHILSYCLDGSYDDNRKIDWKIFFGKLVPRSAFSTNGNNPHCNLLLYFKKCFDLMKIEPPEGNQLDYYYNHDYFPDATKIVVERKFFQEVIASPQFFMSSNFSPQPQYHHSKLLLSS